MDKKYNKYREPVQPVKEVKPKLPSETERRQKVCNDNKIQWEDSLASLPIGEFDSFIKRRLVHRAKWGK